MENTSEYIKLSVLLHNISKTSTSLYHAAKKSKSGWVPDPILWLAWQDYNRKLWVDKNVPVSHSKYYKYMYDSYPPEFGNSMAECHNKKYKCTSVHVYMELTKVLKCTVCGSNKQVRLCKNMKDIIAHCKSCRNSALH